MSLAIEIELISGRYDAAGAGDRDTNEWPPHPARVFCALVASARTEADRDALRWLEQQAAPTIYASAEVTSTSRTGWVVTNTVEKNGGSQFHPARTNAIKKRLSSTPTAPFIRIEWPVTDATPATVSALDELARRVPYLGRSTGVAAITVKVLSDSGSPARKHEGLSRFDPSTGTATGTTSVRVPYPGYLDALAAQFEANQPAWEVSREQRYQRRDETAPSQEAPPARPSVYTDVIILNFTGLRPEGRLATMFTEALRRAVMSSTADPLPAALHGHDADGRPHVAFLALPNVGHKHADGRLMGMAVAIPDLPEDERAAIVRGVLAGKLGSPADGSSGHRILKLEVPRIGQVELAYQPGLVQPWSLEPQRWRRGSTRWVSATPIVLDRYPRKGDFGAEISRSCVQMGLPVPTDVIVSPAPLTKGAVQMTPRDLPDQAKGKLFRHVELRFPHPVSGPVLLGAARYLGIGLMAPVNSIANESEGQS